MLPGFPYEVSSEGSIKGLLRKKALKPWPRGDYLAVHLGSRATISVHRAVALTFLGPCPEGQQVSHRDGNRYNNRASNLEYLSPKENTFRKREHGTHQTGETHPSSVLSAEQVKEIRALRGKALQKDIACFYSVGQTVVSAVQRRKTWRHV